MAAFTIGEFLKTASPEEIVMAATRLVVAALTLPSSETHCDNCGRPKGLTGGGMISNPDRCYICGQLFPI